MNCSHSRVLYGCMKSNNYVLRRIDLSPEKPPIPQHEQKDDMEKKYETLRLLGYLFLL